MYWWEQNNLRLVQTNLRETDATLEPNRLVADLTNMSANTLMMNTGGIVAFYPTDLPFHFTNPYLTQGNGTIRDLIGETVTACHQAGIRFIARFDFSKADESVFAAHPDWFYQNAAGERMRFNSTVATCVNGWYQREGALEILREALGRFDVDGVFFNMFGYQTRDYSGRSFGICHCDGCRAAFLEDTGLPLPPDDDPDNAAWPVYRRFQHGTTRNMLNRIRALVKGVRPDIAISTYDEQSVDMVRKESNTELDRPYPVWQYSASENAQSLEDAWRDKTVSNCCINAVGLDVRFMGVSPHLVESRLYGNLAAGSGLDFCIIGDFPDYPDMAGPRAAANVFRFAAEHESEYGVFRSMAEIALVKPDRFASKEAFTCYLGLFRALKERHMPFEVLHAENLMDGLANGRGRLRAVLLPALSRLDPDAVHLLAELRQEGVHLIATGCVPENLPLGAFPLRTDMSVIPSRSAYLQVEGGRHPSFPDNKFVFLSGPVHPIQYMDNPYPAAHTNPEGALAEASAEPHHGSHLDDRQDTWHIEPFWPILSAGRYGPPEKCGGHGPTPHFGAYMATHLPAEGNAVLIPWHPGTLFLQHGYVEHRDLLVDLLTEELGGTCLLTTNAPSCVEVFLHAHEKGGWMLQFLNHSGFNGTTHTAPLPIHDIHATLRLRENTDLLHAYSLRKANNVQILSQGTVPDGTTILTVSITELNLYEGVRIIKNS